MRVDIREATVDDAEELVAYVQRLCEEPGVMIALWPGEFAITPEQERRFVASMAAEENSLFLVAEVEGRIVGVTTCQGGGRRALRHVTKLGISVERGCRGRGIGTAMMRRVIEWAESSDVVERLELDVFTRNEPAIRFYERLGFQREGVRRRALHRDGAYHDSVVMARILKCEV